LDYLSDYDEVRRRPSELGASDSIRALRPVIVAVTDLVAGVGLGHGGPRFGAYTGVIVAGKMPSNESPLAHYVNLTKEPRMQSLFRFLALEGAGQQTSA
jgi:hypothetical protein